jgi:hypothetical protein
MLLTIPTYSTAINHKKNSKTVLTQNIFRLLSALNFDLVFSGNIGANLKEKMLLAL